MKKKTKTDSEKRRLGDGEKKPTSCFITVDERNSSYDTKASARLTLGGKIVARASCTSGSRFAAMRCAGKALGLPDVPFSNGLNERITLKDEGTPRPGYRLFTAKLNGHPPEPGKEAS